MPRDSEHVAEPIDVGAVDLPWMPIYVDDLLALAAVLTPEQLGGFLRLKAFAWRQTPRCTVPDNDTRLATISGLGASWADAGPAIRERLTPIAGGRLLDPDLHKRWLEQVERYRISMVRKGAGQKGGKRSAAVRGNQPPSNPRSTPPSKAGDLLPGLVRDVLGSEFSGSTARAENLEHAEATAEAKSPAPSIDWRELVDPARARAQRTVSERDVGATVPPAPDPGAPVDSALAGSGAEVSDGLVSVGGDRVGRGDRD